MIFVCIKQNKGKRKERVERHFSTFKTKAKYAVSNILCFQLAFFGLACQNLGPCKYNLSHTIGVFTPGASTEGSPPDPDLNLYSEPRVLRTSGS